MSTETLTDDVTARWDAARERRIARARAEAEPSAIATALSGTGGNGAPPTLDLMRTIRTIGELLYGDRW